MAEIACRLDTETILNMNYLVDIKRCVPGEVARAWLLEEGLIAEYQVSPVYEDPVIVGSKEITELSTTPTPL